MASESSNVRVGFRVNWATVVFLFIIITGVVSLAYIGGPAFWIVVGAIALASVVFLSFALGSWWTGKTMTAGARIAIESAGNNDKFDAVKIKALADLAREVVRIKQDAQQGGAQNNNGVIGYPALPPSFEFDPGNTLEASFTIAGLDEGVPAAGEEGADVFSRSR